MKPGTVNKVKGSEIYGDFVGHDKVTNIVMFQDNEREFVVTHNASIKPVSYFTGRELELQELRQRVEEGRKSVLVSGMGGIGKTQICRELFNEYYNRQMKDKKGEFRHIGYIEYDGDMGSSLVSCLRYKKQENPELNQEAAWKELEDLALKGKLLLFIDNVNKSISEDTGLQRLNHIPGAVIITSRQASFSDEFELYRIGFLNKEQCREIYEKIRFGNSGRKAKPEEVQDLEYIIENLAGKHTITVQLLANLARAKVWGVKKLKEELRIKGFQLQFHNNGKLINIQKSYEVLYNLSGLTEAEQNILEAFSVFPYIPLAAETCNQWLLSDAGVSEDDDILTGLYEKGWLQFDMEHESYSLHPVFAQFIYEKCRPGAETHHGLIEACQEYLEIPESGSVLECQKYIPFAENIVEKIDMGETVEQAEFMDSLAFLLYHKGEYKKAEGLYKKVLLIREKVLGEEHPSTAASYNNLAMVYDSQGKYKEAEELYKKALLIIERVLGEGHPDTAVGYNNLALVYDSQGKYKEAEGLYKKALLIREKVLGEGHPDTAVGYNNLAFVYDSQGKYKDAEGLYKKALLISENVLGEEHPSTATSYNNLAVVYKSQGKYKEAEELYKKALLIREKVLGTEHPSTAISYNNLAGFYHNQEKYKISLSYCCKAYKIFVLKLGVKHPNTQTVYDNMEMAYFEYNPKGDFKQWLEEKMKETE